MPYQVRTSVFEGPFDLLLHLICREEVDLYEVSLAGIVDAYLAELAGVQAGGAALDLEVATEFLLVAATLVELKSRRLLPGRAEIDLDEELVGLDQRDLLLSRLAAGELFRAAARRLAALEEAGGRSFPRAGGLDESHLAVVPDLLAGVSPADLGCALARVTRPSPPPRIDLAHLSTIRANVATALAELVEELPGRGPVSFRRLTSALTERIEIVVRFLALLELFKHGLVDLRQAGAFADIEVTWLGAPGGAALEVVGIDAYGG
ncbi:MAG: segregation and condensation protein A [Acidimicrobiales bacterium]